MTKNKIRDHYRDAERLAAPRGGSTAHRVLQGMADLGEVDPDQQANFDTTPSLVHRSLEFVKAEFENPTWDAFWRTAVERHLAAEVAQDMGMTVAAVYKAKSRVLHRLRTELSGLLE